MALRDSGIDQRDRRQALREAEAARAATDRLPDAAESDQAQGLAGEPLHALDCIPAPVCVRACTCS